VRVETVFLDNHAEQVIYFLSADFQNVKSGKQVKTLPEVCPLARSIRLSGLRHG
jgi:hypothetical protein